MNTKELLGEITSGRADDKFALLYGNREDVIEKQKNRYATAITRFEEIYPGHQEISIFSAPGRTEICGNHTDHQQGCVLAAAVNLDAIAVVGFHQERVIRLQSEGYDPVLINLDDLAADPQEKGTTASLIRGMAAQFQERGAKVEGFHAFVTSDVLSGSGLSSSAAFEVLLGNIMDRQYNEERAGAVEIARMGQIAENKYFGKESGLMDQMVSSVGGFVFIDFKDTAAPVIEKHECDFQEGGLQLIITDTKGSHAELTEDYVSVPAEMKSVAAQFGKKVLREVEEEKFYNSLGQLRLVCSDRAILRAAHYYGENKRVEKEVEALEAKEFAGFLQLVRESGKSSAQLLQNLYSTKRVDEQGIPLALMAGERILGEKGACRVHGGGFAGTMQAFVPKELVAQYKNAMTSLFGEGCCYVLDIRSAGGCQVF